MRPLVECISILYNERLEGAQLLDDEIVLTRGGQINWVKAKISHILPYTIHVVLQGLEEILPSLDEEKQRNFI